MAWVNESGNNYRRRIPITLYKAAGTTSVQVSVPIPSHFDKLWETIGDGTGLRVTAANGYTILPHILTTPAGVTAVPANFTARNVHIVFDATVPSDSEVVIVFYLYYIPIVDTPGAAGPTYGTPLAGAMELGNPSGHVMMYRAPRPGQTRPRFTIRKRVVDRLVVWIGLPQFLERAGQSFAARDLYEEVAMIDVGATRDDDAAANDLCEATDVRVIEIGGGRQRGIYLRIVFKDGSVDRTYTATVEIQTLIPGDVNIRRIEEIVFGVEVVDDTEPAL